jgi:hypothetical protein
VTAEPDAPTQSEIRGANLEWKSRSEFHALFLPSAHLGHWYVQLAFAAPALAIIGYMTRDSLRRRRRERRERLRAKAGERRGK